MIRLSSIVWLVLVALVGFGMFEVKYEVMDLEDTLARTNRSIVADEDAIHVLKAEWSYLSQPSRLEELSRRYLQLAPLNTAQVGQIDSIPMRPEAAPPAAVAGSASPPQAPARPGAPSSSQPSQPVKAPAATMTALANARMRTDQ